MKKLLLTLALVACVAAPAAALDMTADQLMQKMHNCASCKPLAENPALGAAIRYDVVQTDNGSISAFMLADESLMPAFQAAMSKCEANKEAVMKLTAEQRKAQLCPFCAGGMSLMARDDVVVNHYPTKLGFIGVATSKSAEGVKAIHANATTTQEASELLASMGAAKAADMKGKVAEKTKKGY